MQNNLVGVIDLRIAPDAPELVANDSGAVLARGGFAVLVAAE
jgi:hypothetical protein